MKRLLLALGFVLPAWTADAPAPEQPLPFSHKQHLALKLECRNCHTMPGEGEQMTFPAESKCMACHASIKKDSPHIQKLAAYAEKKQPVPWVRVYQIPTYVYWSHKVHLESSASCEKCHGPVREREKIFRETDISMGGCMNCHRENKASLDCTSCHAQLND